MNRRRFVLASLASSAGCALLGDPTFAAMTEPPAALQQQLAHDPLRPQFHLLPRRNWMNDPCAPRYHQGQYHMFFQYNPHAAIWGDMHWNHATSPDLIHWKHQPIALAPGPGAFDQAGIFTGSVLPGAGQPTILYTGVRHASPEEETIRGGGLREVQCLATSSDPALRTWHKLDHPVIDAPPPGLKITGFRDPCPWKDGGLWYLIVGSGFNSVGGAVLLYSSRDGRQWTYLHPLAQGQWNGTAQKDPVDSGEMWECPDFFPLGDKHVLLYSTERKVYWNVGTFDKKELRFHTETAGFLDHGSYYAMKSMLDEKGRRLLWGWVEETRSPEACIKAGWAGSMALPRVLSIAEDNRLRMDVPLEFASLERDAGSYHPSPSATFASWLSKQSLPGRSARLQYTFAAGAQDHALSITAAHQQTPLLSLTYRNQDGKATLSIGDKSLTLSPDQQRLSTIDLWIDGSVIEVFADRQEAATLRDYTNVSGPMLLAWEGPAGALHSIKLSAVAPISPDRLTT